MVMFINILAQYVTDYQHLRNVEGSESGGLPVITHLFSNHLDRNGVTYYQHDYTSDISKSPDEG